MACDPPTLKIFFILQILQTYKISIGISPFLSGGVHSTLLGQSAIKEGIPNIKTVEKSGAVPPGI